MKKDNTLKGRSLFREVIINGTILQDRHMRVYILKCNNVAQDENRLSEHLKANNIKIGISLNRRFGKAYERNKVKRRIRAIVDMLSGRMKGRLNIVFRPDQSFLFLSFQMEKDIIEKLLVKTGAL